MTNSICPISILILLTAVWGCRADQGIVVPPPEHYDTGQMLPKMLVHSEAGELIGMDRILIRDVNVLVFGHLKHPSSRAQIVLLDGLYEDLGTGIGLNFMIVSHRGYLPVSEYRINRPYDVPFYAVDSDRITWLGEDFVLPLLFFVDSQGRILARHDGYILKQQLMEILDQCRNKDK